MKLATHRGKTRLDRKRIILLVGLILVAWASTGLYRVQPDEQGLVLRFGALVGVSGPGLHYRLPYPVDAVLLPNVTRINQLQVGHADALPTRWANQMLTGDENIVDADSAVFWRIQDPIRFVFSGDDPERTIAIAAESAVREVVGRNPIQSTLSDRRQQIADEIQAVLQQMLDTYGLGVAITQVQLQRVDPPAAVIEAFNDVQRARADQERERNEADAYHNDILPRARGEAQRIAQEAQGYRSQVVSLAEGDVQGYRAVYNSYRQAPDATAWRLYLDSVDELVRRAERVIVDPSGRGASSLLPYWPGSGSARAIPNTTASPTAERKP